VEKIKELLTGKNKPLWIGFDLDNTLHDFTSAEQASRAAALKFISDKYKLPLDILSQKYEQIFRYLTIAFTDGRSSYELRKERYELLLKDLVVEYDIEEIVEIVVSTYLNALILKESAIELLQLLKQKNFQIAVISDGIHDSRLAILNKLGLDKYIDLVISSGKERILKKDGLFDRFFEISKCSPSSFIFIGDSIESDILPGQKFGFCTIHFDEHNVSNVEPSISSLKELINILK
jgi:putative hydrolase of the HAD superfamily